MTNVDNAIAGNLFACNSSLTAGGGEYPYVQLWNPLASGKILVVSKVEGRCEAAGVNSLNARTHNAALTTTINGAPPNLSIGETAAAADMLAESLVANNTGTTIVSVRTEQYEWKKLIESPVVVPQGQGLMVMSWAVGSRIDALFEWKEASA